MRGFRARYCSYELHLAALTLLSRLDRASLIASVVFLDVGLWTCDGSCPRAF